jgi:16S rRNA (cytidine1402-2'-O)-methyltransferase
MPGTLFVVATPIGNLEDITARALRVLREVQLIAAEDTRRTAQLLARYAISTPTTSFHQHNESAKSAAILGRLRGGENIALVSDAGTPTVSDPGTQLIRDAITAGIRVEPVPGPSAVLAALTASGIAAQTFTFLGFPPTRSKDRELWFEALRTLGRPAIFFEAPHRIRATLEQIRRRMGDCSVTVGRELTKLHEEFVRGPISEVLGHLESPVGEFTVVLEIGQSPNNEPHEPLSPAQALLEIGQMIASESLSRRQAIGRLAKRHSLAPNVIYDLLEDAKRSGK